MSIKQSLKYKVSANEVIRKSKTPTVVVNQPVYLKDRNRFFKEAWEEENKQLFFK